MGEHPLVLLLPRAARAAALAAACVLLAALGHVLASQAVLPQSTVLQAWIVLLCVGCAFARRERALPAIAAFVLGAQAALFLWFQAAELQGSAARCVAVTNLPPGLTVPGMCGTAVPGWAQTGLLICMHVAAALLCAWWLRRGEAALFTLGRLLVEFGRALLTIPAALLRAFVPYAGPQRSKFPRRRGRPPRPAAVSHLPVVRRGPPLPLCSA
ncbi:hypothetical protein KGA66_13160 [Actinocrinis puniceicyclus]|uniref:Integral membrane protein n=1 Tax=Actinocrinis puniceicyclus TaxID=977794 RepID=A0A8J8BEQ8_9ACTN|nr:hypothetical protein [Actinocrinis puniceicyclus]MBS2963999.1 hypothetical protein [Actinocrinis puniceicyclus]